jgi:hypothetical protein
MGPEVEELQSPKCNSRCLRWVCNFSPILATLMTTVLLMNVVITELRIKMIRALLIFIFFTELQ